MKRSKGKYDPTTGEEEQVRYGISTIKVLHRQFMSSENIDISLSQFSAYFPKSVVIPKADDWGTSLCQKCTNPMLKFMALKKLGVCERVPEDPKSCDLPEEDDLPEEVNFMKWERDETIKVKKLKKKPTGKRVSFTNSRRRSKIGPLTFTASRRNLGR